VNCVVVTYLQIYRKAHIYAIEKGTEIIVPAVEGIPSEPPGVLKEKVVEACKWQRLSRNHVLYF
jgi:hypothetical protein